ncbi:MAG TPA: lipid A export permease/ATP-binding protein MsbA [Spongiibacteraceae bacterium]|nr:lipid A export permease/ATP-binding protein MsbA [Spongiibacteraceae bacterium]
MKLEEQVEHNRLRVYLRLLSYVRPYAGLFALSIVGFLIFGATEPLQAKLLGVFVKAVQGKDYNARFYIPALLIGLYIVRGIGSFVGSYYLSKVSNNVVHDLRTETFSHVLYLPTRFYDDNNSGHIISRIIYNTGQVTAAATDALKTVVREGFTVVGLFAYVFYLNWKMSLVFIAVAPVVGLIVTKVGNKLRKLSRKMQHSAGELTQVCNETITGHRVVRSFSGEEYEKQRFEDASRDNLRRSLKMVQIAATNTPVLQLLVICAMGLIMFLVLQPAFLQHMSVEAYVTYITAIALIPKPLRQLGEINGVIQKGIAAAESVFEIIDLPKEINTGTRRIERLHGKIELRDLTFSYPDTPKPALENINLVIEPGQTVALVGRSGSGKSTLASLISQFYRHEQGSILIDGIDIHEYDLYALREQIGVVTQSVTLFNDTVANNIAYGKSARGHDLAAIREAARQAYALDFIEALPEQFETLVGENGVKLSGGQKQRIAIARALLKNSPILVLDEATSALDNESERYIQLALERAMTGRTTLVIAHRLSTIETADLIVVMDSGRIVEQGTHAQLLQRHGVYASLHSSDFAA